MFGCVCEIAGYDGVRSVFGHWCNLCTVCVALELASCVSVFSGGICNAAEMCGVSSFGLYLREIVQRVHSSTSRYLMNCVQITEKHFAVLRLLQKIPAKSPLLLTALGVVKMTTPTSSC